MQAREGAVLSDLALRQGLRVLFNGGLQDLDDGTLQRFHEEVRGILEERDRLPQNKLLHLTLNYVRARAERNRLKAERNALECEAPVTIQSPCWRAYPDILHEDACAPCRERDALHGAYTDAAKAMGSAWGKLNRLASKLVAVEDVRSTSA